MGIIKDYYYKRKMHDMDYKGIIYKGRIDTILKREELKAQLRIVFNPEFLREEMQNLDNLIYEAEYRKEANNSYLFPSACNIVYGGEIAAIFTLITMMKITAIQSALWVFFIVVLVFAVTAWLLERSDGIFTVEMEKIDYYKTIKTLLREIYDQSKLPSESLSSRK